MSSGRSDSNVATRTDASAGQPLSEARIPPEDLSTQTSRGYIPTDHSFVYLLLPIPEGVDLCHMVGGCLSFPKPRVALIGLIVYQPTFHPSPVTPGPTFEDQRGDPG